MKPLRKRGRLRDLGIGIGIYPTGEFNAITDVKGVNVGHSTIIRGKGEKNKPGKGPVRTGVTVILPNDNIFNHKLIASGFVLNGAGEVSGLTQVKEWGLLETPIALTNTMSVGKVSESIVKWMSLEFNKIWNHRQVVIPVVGECDDSFLNDSVGFHVKDKNVFEAIDNAASGIVTEGSVGAGTGMICCDFKGGIGTSSRVIKIGAHYHTIGILVLSNFGIMEELRVDGIPFGRIIAKKEGDYERRRNNYGSIITVLATDLPLSPGQIERLCKRAALGIGRVGSHASHGSGEIIIGFSTGNIIEHGNMDYKNQLSVVADAYINPAYQAAIEATEEAIINSLTSSVEMYGVDDHHVPALDLQLLTKLMSGFKDFEDNFVASELAAAKIL